MMQQILGMLPPRMYLELKYWDYRRTQKVKFEAMQKRRRNTSENGYSYEPFDKHKSIFVHIPKCAGVSVSRALYGNLAGGHTSFDKYTNIFEPKRISEYFTFTVVRNPWD